MKWKHYENILRRMEVPQLLRPENSPRYVNLPAPQDGQPRLVSISVGEVSLQPEQGVRRPQKLEK